MYAKKQKRERNLTKWIRTKTRRRLYVLSHLLAHLLLMPSFSGVMQMDSLWPMTSVSTNRTVRTRNSQANKWVQCTSLMNVAGLGIICYYQHWLRQALAISWSFRSFSRVMKWNDISCCIEMGKHAKWIFCLRSDLVALICSLFCLLREIE